VFINIYICRVSVPFDDFVSFSAICLPAKQNNRKTNKKCGALLLALRLASVKMAANLAGGSKGGKMMAVSWGGGARLGG